MSTSRDVAVSRPVYDHENKNEPIKFRSPVFNPIRGTSNSDGGGTASTNSSVVKDKIHTTPNQARRSPNATPEVNGSKDEDNTIRSNPTSGRSSRGSGGFLLARSSPVAGSPQQVATWKDKQEKRKNEGLELSVPKKSRRSDLGKPAPRSSPLSAELRSDSPRSGFPSSEFGASSSKTEEDGINSSRSSRLGPGMPNGSSVDGLDTDAAQIIDMALKLGEGRRRQESGKRFVSGELGGRRIVSNPTPVKDRSESPVRGAVPNSTVRRRFLHHHGPKQPVSALPSAGLESSQPDHADLDGGAVPVPTSVSPVPAEDERPIEVSQSTARRVEKAKTYFELAYEHRRLLSHLPPLRITIQNSKRHVAEPTTKVYNPLQYSRNRKLRIRERNTFQAEKEGWHDVNKVRAWIDTVVSSHTQTRHDPMECIRLPPLSLQEEDAIDGEDPLANGQRLVDPQDLKPRRPRSDWSTHPGDLLADAYWLEQGLNKLKIYDRDNNAIYPADTQFTFTGWRNRTPLNVPPRLQEPTPPPDQNLEKTPASAMSALPDLPTFRSSQSNRTRRMSKLGVGPVKSEADPRKKGLDIFDTSSETSSEPPSPTQEPERRGRKLRSRKPENVNLLDGNPFDPAVRTKERDGRTNSRRQSETADESSRSQRGASHEHASPTRLRKRSARNRASRETSTDMELSKPRETRRQAKKQARHEKHWRRHSTDEDTNSPASPTAFKFPSIAINLSPPNSRSPSPTKKGRHSVFDVVKGRIGHNHDRVDVNDFAQRTRSSSRTTSVDNGTHGWSSDQPSRGPSPMSRGLSPHAQLSRKSTAKDEPSPSPLEHRTSTVSKTSVKTADSHPQHSHRIRGMFKGGRIAELVGNEVSRVGDYIWKREPPRRSLLDPSSQSDEDSGTDGTTEKPHDMYKTPPLPSRRSYEANQSSGRDSTGSPQLTKTSSHMGDQHQYHVPNLPSFTSPFQKDKEQQEKRSNLLAPSDSPLVSRDDDPVSRLAVQHRSASKSPRLGRLAPPKIDTSGGQLTSPAPRRDSYGFGAALDLSRPKSASQLYNKAINQAAAMRLADPQPKSSRQPVAGQTDGAVEKKSVVVTKRDISRMEAMLLMSAVKSQNIAVYADAVPHHQSQFLVDALEANDADSGSIQSLRLRRREEHVLAARNLITVLKKQNDAFNDSLEEFSSKIVNDLHKEIQILEDRVEKELTPRVRLAADEAGDLSMKLTTTSTLAIRGLNDQIGEAMRLRRRGPLRWMRKFGYGVIEWVVVGLLWGIWFVVTVARFCVGGLKAATRVLCWMLWAE